MENTININWEELGFSYTPTKSMYMAHCNADETWQKGALQPFGEISISPAACVLNYGQGLFEGLKAYRSKDGEKIVLFRPEHNAQRMADGCQRLCIPPITKEVFLDAILSVTKANIDYIPPYQKDSLSQGALYLRPVMWGTGPKLGVAPSLSYTFLVYACPVGPYFKSGFQPIKLKITHDYHRAAMGGTGGTKAIGNYAVGMLPARIAKSEGFQEVLYLDSREGKHLEEVGAANFFCLHGNTLITPELDGCILPGITRQSIIQLASERFGLKVEERKVKLEEALTADEAFGSGTAAVITPIGSIFYNDKEHFINNGEVGQVSRKLYETLLGIQHCIEEDTFGWLHTVC